MTKIHTTVAATETFSGAGTVIELGLPRAAAPPTSAPKKTLSELNRKFASNADQVEYLAKANTMRLTGHPSL